MPRKINYKNYYVAFLDILGFKNIVKNSSANDIHKMFNNIKVIEDIIKGRNYYKSPFRNIEKNTFFLYFSDSIVCAIPSDIANSFEMLTSHCMLIQHYFWTQSNPIWIRGAIVRGELYCRDNEVFGPALVEAYKLEENVAKYPRIIMTRATYDDGIKNLELQEDIGYIVDTEDGLKMIESLKYSGLVVDIDKLRTQIEDVISTETTNSIREKYLWIKDYFNTCVDDKSKYKAFKTPIK